MAEAQEVTYYVRQNCDGCTRSVGKLLQKAKDANLIESYSVTEGGQKAYVTLAPGKTVKEAVPQLPNGNIGGKTTSPWDAYAEANPDKLEELKVNETKPAFLTVTNGEEFGDKARK